MPETPVYESKHYEEIPDIEGEVEDETYREYIAEIKSRLGERETEIFEMMVENSLSIDETARKLGIGKPATLTAWYRLRKKLEGILKEIF
jgi:DNA-directed RNA polymerase specialized sigma24 family protein